jgi:TonB family protein
MTRILVLGLAALLSFAADAAAQKDLARERVSLLFKDTPVTKVIPALAKSLGYEITLDPTLRAMVTLQVENVTAQTALNAICESIGCKWRQQGNQLIVEARTETIAIMQPTEKGEQFTRRGGNLMNYAMSGLEDTLPFDITWSPGDVYTAFHVLARMLDADVEIAPALNGRKLAVTIKAATMSQAFDAVCSVAGCRWQLVEKPKRVVRVTARGQEEAAPSASDRLYETGEAGLKPPVAISEVKPGYTQEAKQARIQGQVVVSCVVLPDGSVVDVKVIDPLDPGLDEQAIKAARQWRFKAGTKDGRPVPVRIDLEFTFTLR